ncbi:MbtH family protein [Gryllotalpicola reticulitermitis]|uniref:MbtH family protein n=1 Tax=Gryllotalpicola reticulitermitis TaxID=1184153 RepID=A0ABV8QC01_9MICO
MTALPPSALKQVVVNHEGQYSLWAADERPPAGWQPEGFVASEDVALDYIARVWTDMTPRSARIVTSSAEQVE